MEHVRKVKALERLERKEFTILVPLANPESAESLLRIALAIAQRNNAEIVLLHVVEVDQGVPLQAAVDEGKSRATFLNEAKAQVETAGIPVRAIVEVAHRISQGILDTALEEQANFIILGRGKRSDFMERVFSSVVDTILDEAPCEVAILHGSIPAEGIKRILIPLGENIHTQLALEIAPSLVEYFKATAEVVVVMEPEATKIKREEQRKRIDRLVSSRQLPGTVKIVRGRGIRQGIVQHSRNADLMVMGGRSGDLLGLLFGQSLTQEITEQSACPVLWVNEFEEQPSRWSLFLKPFRKEVERSHE